MRLYSFLAIALPLLAMLASPAFADQRTYSVTSFSRIRVEGPVTLVVTTGVSPTARVEGGRQAIDRLRVETSDGLLMVGLDRSNWTGTPDNKPNAGAILYVGASDIEQLSVIGPGDVLVDRVRGARLTIILSGTAKAAVNAVDVDTLAVTINGAGDLRLAGTARQGRLRSQGNGTIDAAGLKLDDADIVLTGSGDIQVAANRSARTNLKGSGRVVIEGSPACSGSSEGSGQVICGGAAQ